MNTLGDELPKEIERCEALLKIYDEIGPVGAFGKMMIARDISAAKKAIMDGDVVAMIMAYKALQSCK